MPDIDPGSNWFELSIDLFAEANLEGYFTRLNGSWERCLGFSVEELLARPYLESIHPDDVERTSAAACSLAEAPKHIVNFEVRFATKDGGWRCLLWSARSDGERIYAVGKDISERKEHEAEREFLLKQVEALARIDKLTGLANRRALDEAFDHELALAGRLGHQITVALLDIDRFKSYNDTHGHPAGDELLREAACAWRIVMRETDFIARYGGEEFFLILPGCPPADATEIVQRLVDATPGGQTLSGGIASWNRTESAASLLSRVDRALYAAKSAGRNCLVEASAD